MRQWHLEAAPSIWVDPGWLHAYHGHGNSVSLSQSRECINVKAHGTARSHWPNESICWWALVKEGFIWNIWDHRLKEAAGEGVILPVLCGAFGSHSRHSDSKKGILRAHKFGHSCTVLNATGKKKRFWSTSTVLHYIHSWQFVIQFRMLQGISEL